MSGVVLRNVEKVYPNGHVAVKDASLDIAEGEFVILVGPSGCGKSTLLRMIAGLEEVTSGEIVIGDRVVNDVAPKDRNISMVFQNYALYPHMTVRQNMAFALKQAKMPRNEIDRRVANAAEILGLDEMLDRKPKEMSGGQRQRVAVGRAIVRDADVFLFDEPLSNLDASLRTQMRTEIAKLHQRLGKTMIYVTHDQVEAMTMADRIVVVKGGDVLQFDSPLEIYRRPVDRFVAGFIGSPSMNMLKGRIEALDGDTSTLRFVDASETMSCSLPEEVVAGFDLAPGIGVTLGVRPEDIYLDESDAEHPDRVPVTMIVDVLEPMGNEVIVHSRLNGSAETAVVSRGRLEVLPRVGESVAAGIDLSRVSFFDAASGNSLARASVESGR